MISQYLLDFDTPNSAERFLSYSRDHIFLLAAHFGTTAAIKTKRYSLIMKFVPCTGDFDPQKAKCIAEIEDTCSLSRGSIISANWIKRPDRCAPSAAFQGQKLVSSLQINLCKHPSFNIVTFCVTYCHKKAKLFISLLIPLLTWVGALSTLLKIKIFFDCVLWVMIYVTMVTMCDKKAKSLLILSDSNLVYRIIIDIITKLRSWLIIKINKLEMGNNWCE